MKTIEQIDSATSSQHKFPYELVGRHFAQAIELGVSLMELPEAIVSEAQNTARRIGADETLLAATGFNNYTTELRGTLLDPITRLMGGNVYMNMCTLPLQPSEDGMQHELHVDDFNIREGLSLLIPTEGPDAELYFADSRGLYPVFDGESVVYGVGSAVLLRQSVRLFDESGNVVKKPAKYHGGWCREGARKILSIDLHGREIIPTSVELVH